MPRAIATGREALQFLCKTRAGVGADMWLGQPLEDGPDSWKAGVLPCVQLMNQVSLGGLASNVFVKMSCQSTLGSSYECRAQCLDTCKVELLSGDSCASGLKIDLRAEKKRKLE